MCELEIEYITALLIKDNKTGEILDLLYKCSFKEGDIRDKRNAILCYSLIF